MESPVELVTRMNQEIDRVVSPFVNQKPFALLDFPDYPNVRDSAIWLGNIAFFSRKGLAPSCISRMTRIDSERLKGQETIVLSGGGNFGDIWSEHWPNCQAFREAVMERFPGKKIVQLPQSIHFNSRRNVDSAARAIEALRDRKSLDFARKNFQCQVGLCPDMAYALGPLAKSYPPKKNVLFLLRTDIERASNAADGMPKLPSNSDIADWLVEPFWIAGAAIMAAMATHGLSFALKRIPRERLVEKYFDNKARLRLARGLRLLSNYKTVVSDRLHVHILCCLLGIPHIMLDNSYGKIGGFMDAFSTKGQGSIAPTI